MSVPTLVILLIYSGYIKEAPAFAWIPLDLTLISAVLVVVVAVATVLRSGALPRELTPLVFLLAALMIPLAWSDISPPYAAEKIMRLPITAVSAFGAAVLVNSRRRLIAFEAGFVGFGLMMVTLAYIAPTNVELYGRLAIEGSNTIALARAAGAALVVLLISAFTHRLSYAAAGVLAIPLALMLLGSGSRGPALATLLAVGVALATARGQRRVRSILLATAASVLLASFAVGRISAAAKDRFTLLLGGGGDRGESVGIREILYDRTFSVALQSPFGVGWGGLDPILDPLARYPHNLILELVAESGWLAMIVFAAVLVISWRRAAAFPALLGLLVYWFANAQVSGDINDNRMLFAVIGVSLVLPSLGQSKAIRGCESVATRKAVGG